MYFEIQDKNAKGEEMRYAYDENGNKTTLNRTVELEVTDIGYMTLHIGANKDQTLDVSIAEVSSEKLWIDKLDYVKKGGPEEAIESLDKALSKVTSLRSKIGAYSNRLEYAVGSLDQYSENMNSAVSRIKDTDMAEEMSEYSKYQVLSQASTSVLAQANDMPQQVLQLLQ